MCPGGAPKESRQHSGSSYSCRARISGAEGIPAANRVRQVPLVGTEQGPGACLGLLFSPVYPVPLAVSGGLAPRSWERLSPCFMLGAYTRRFAVAPLPDSDCAFSRGECGLRRRGRSTGQPSQANKKTNPASRKQLAVPPPRGCDQVSSLWTDLLDLRRLGRCPLVSQATPGNTCSSYLHQGTKACTPRQGTWALPWLPVVASRCRVLAGQGRSFPRAGQRRCAADERSCQSPGPAPCVVPHPHLPLPPHHLSTTCRQHRTLSLAPSLPDRRKDPGLPFLVSSWVWARRKGKGQPLVLPWRAPPPWRIPPRISTPR
jgi:hypothetical protein